MDVEGAHIACHARAVAFLDMIADHDEVLIHDRRRRHAGIPARETIADLGSVDIHNSVGAEFGVRNAGFGVQRDQLAAQRSDHDLGRSQIVAGEIFHAAQSRTVARGQVVDPELLSGRGIERRQLAIRRANIHHSIHDERSDLGGAEAGAGASAAATARGGSPAGARTRSRGRRARSATGATATAAAAAIIRRSDKVRRLQVIRPGNFQIGNICRSDLR